MLDVKKVKRKKFKQKLFNFVESYPKQNKIYKPLLTSVFLEDILISIGAFNGDYASFTHFSQYFYILGFKNKCSFYNINISIFILNNALRFLKIAAYDSKTQFVLAGAPTDIIKRDYNHLKSFLPSSRFTIFPNEKWESGYISKIKTAANTILILFNPTLNNSALREGVYSKIPIVGFVTPICDIRNIDYPILLNLKIHTIWYYSLIKFFFYTVINDRET
jgi:hypothetical protein